MCEVGVDIIWFWVEEGVWLVYQVYVKAVKLSQKSRIYDEIPNVDDTWPTRGFQGRR